MLEAKHGGLESNKVILVLKYSWIFHPLQCYIKVFKVRGYFKVDTDTMNLKLTKRNLNRMFVFFCSEIFKNNKHLCIPTNWLRCYFQSHTFRRYARQGIGNIELWVIQISTDIRHCSGFILCNFYGFLYGSWGMTLNGIRQSCICCHYYVGHYGTV